MMITYKFDQKSAQKAISKVLPFRIFLIFMAITAGLFMSLKDIFFDSLIINVITILIVIVVTLYAIKKLIKDQTQKLLSYELIIEDNKVLKRQIDIRDIEIKSHEIIKITEIGGRGIDVKTVDNMKRIFISNEIEGYPEIKKVLSNWKEFDQRENDSFYKIRSLCASLLGLGLICIIITQSNKYLVLAAGAVMLGLLSISLISLCKNHQINKNINFKMSLFSILFVSIMIISKILIVLR